MAKQKFSEAEIIAVMKPSGKKMWIGLAQVEQRSRNGVLGDADRAFTNAIGNAVSRYRFRKRH